MATSIDELMELAKAYGWAAADHEHHQSDDTLDAMEMAEQELRAGLVALSAAPAAPQPAQSAGNHRPDRQWYERMIQETLDDDFEIGPAFDEKVKDSAAPAAPKPVQPLDLSVMELAESVGLIGPASRTDDLHEAIQRFHDLIVANASIKAALHFADGLAQPARCPQCNYQHGHQIGCENNPVDIALKAQGSKDRP